MPVLAKHPSSPVEILVPFEQLARNLAARLSSMVPLPLQIVDELGQVIVESDGNGQDVESVGTAAARGQRQVRIPFQIGDCTGVVVFCCRGSGWDESPGVLATITRQLVSQMPDLTNLQPRRSPRDLFVSRLLHGNYANKREALELAQLWHIDLSIPRSVILIESRDSTAESNNHTLRPPRRKLSHIYQFRDHVSDLFSDLDGTTCAYIGGGRVALLTAQNHVKASTEQIGSADFARAARTILEKAAQTQTAVAQGVAGDYDYHAMRLAAGNPYRGVYGLTRSYREALQSLEKRSAPCDWQLARTLDTTSTPLVAGEGFWKYSGLA